MVEIVLKGVITIPVMTSSESVDPIDFLSIRGGVNSNPPDIRNASSFER